MQERTIEEWTEWAIPPPAPDDGWWDPNWWKSIPVGSQWPDEPLPSDPIDPRSRYQVAIHRDWMTDPATALRYGDGVIGKQGGLEATSLSGGATAGGGWIGGSTTVTIDGQKSIVGTTGMRSGFTVVAGGGLSTATLGTLAQRNGISSGAILGGAAGSAKIMGSG